MSVTLSITDQKKIPTQLYPKVTQPPATADNQFEREHLYDQIQESDFQTPVLPNAMKLFDDAIQLARRQEADVFQRDMRRERQRELTEQKNTQPAPFAVTTDGSGWNYVEIGGACFTYREGDPMEQFDEPVMMYTRCRSKEPERDLFADLMKKETSEN